jgi:hypothetical protein
MKNLMFYVKFAILLAIMGWIAKAWAVPNDVKAEVLQGTVGVHQGGCEWQGRKMPCQIYFREADETIYLVLYTDDTTAITHVVRVKDKVETILYVNPKFVA